MTFTYNAAPGTNVVDTIRFLVGDTREAEHFLEDEEITYLSSQWEDKDSDYYTASMAAEAIAAKLTREIDISSDGQNVGLGALRDKFMALAESLNSQYRDALVGGSSLYAGGMDAHESRDYSVKPLSFGTGMHDHPEAGGQDFGDMSPLEYAQWRAQWGEEVP